MSTEPTTSAPSTKKITVCLTGRPPVTIDPRHWGLIARADDHDNQYDFQANRIWRLKVRQHDDGRVLVYGLYHTAFQNERSRDAGELLEAPYDGHLVAAAIHRVAAAIGAVALADACVCDLPAEEV